MLNSAAGVTDMYEAAQVQAMVSNVAQISGTQLAGGCVLHRRVWRGVQRTTETAGKEGHVGGHKNAESRLH